ncbi:MAG: hypothetical protein ABFD83_06350, partial [Armatimonadota bacterium]
AFIGVDFLLFPHIEYLPRSLLGAFTFFESTELRSVTDNAIASEPVCVSTFFLNNAANTQQRPNR